MATAKLLIQDAQLIEQCLQNDELSFSMLYHRYAKGVFHAALRIVNQQAEAEDIVQEAFCKAFEQLKDLKNQANFEGWTKRIAINMAISKLRERKISFISEEGIDELPDEETDYDEETIFQYRVEEVRNAINSLPDGYRSIISLYLFDEISQDEIAKILGISAVTVRTQYHRAKKKVYQNLKEQRNGNARFA